MSAVLGQYGMRGIAPWDAYSLRETIDKAINISIDLVEELLLVITHALNLWGRRIDDSRKWEK